MLARLREIFSSLGVLDGTCFLLSHSLLKLSGARARLHKYYLVAQPVSQSERARPGGSFGSAEIGPDSELIVQLPRPEENIRLRWAQAARCIAINKGEKLVGCAWLAFRNYKEDEVRCTFELHPPESTVWDFDVYIDPQHRMGRAFLTLWDQVNVFLRANGVSWSLSRISAFNRESLASHKRLGCITVGSCIFFSIGKLQLLLSSLPPYVHFSGSELKAPTIVVTAPTILRNESAAARAS